LDVGVQKIEQNIESPIGRVCAAVGKSSFNSVSRPVTGLFIALALAAAATTLGRTAVAAEATTGEAEAAAGVGAEAGTETTPTTTKKKKVDESLDEVVVTGSRIPRPELERLEPTQVVTSDFLDKRSYTNVIDALNELPEFGEPDNSLVGGQSSFGVGQSFANFFSLGSQRTLTLVDGRRFVPANSPSIFGATGNGGEQVDLNVIPTMLIDRVETIAVGGAPIYGSDAIAGTVNIILKHNFEGLDIDAQGGISDQGDAGSGRVRLLAGKNFADGEGNLTISAELANQNALFDSDRRAYTYDNFFNENANPTPYAYTLIANQRLGSISTMGVPMVDDDYLNFAPNVGIYNSAGQLQSFNQGKLAPYTLGPPDGTEIYNIGGSGLDFAHLQTILSPQERINGTLLGDFKFNENVRLFGEAWFSSTHTEYPEGQAEYDTALFAPAGQVSGNLILNVNNPFLSAADQALIQQNLNAYAAIPGNPTQTSQFYLARLNQDIADGATTANQITRRGVIGLNGTIPIPDHELNYEVSANYGRTENASTSPSLNFQDYTNALNAVKGPGGTIICAPGYTNSPVPTQSNTCAPFNPFGFGIESAAAHAYVTDLAQAVSTLTQRDLLATVNGDVLPLPAGKLKFSFGYENRLESADFEPDQFYQQGLGYSIPIGPIAGSFKTNEVFGELLVPVFAPEQGIPALNRLELEGAAREVDHSVAGKALTWTAGLRWEPVSAVQFRGNYTRSIRAPSVTEAFLPTSEAFNTAQDPCDKSLINSGPDPAVRAANCAKAGIVQPFTSNILNFTEPITVSGDPTLQNEIADSRTFGVVLRPLQKMTLTIDYISIDIEDAITDLSATNVLDACYDNPTYPNAECSKVSRGANGQITLVQTGYANEGFENFNGVTLQWDYAFDLPRALGQLDVAINHFYENHLSQAVGIEDVTVLPGTVGNSKHRGSVDFTWTKSQLYALWQARYVGRAVWDNTLPGNNANFNGVGTWWVNNLTVGASPIENLKVQLVVNNIFDKQAPYPFPAEPPNAQLSGGLSTYYEGILGRNFVLSANYKFDPFR
jgi:outer membrane receptor protein involved in Fe transport